MMTSSLDTKAAQPARLTDREELRRHVGAVFDRTPVLDMHTHLYAPEFGELGLSGIDELLTYHYLVAETFRTARVGYEEFWRMTKTEQADLVWRTLFVEHTPVSEAARGVVTVLEAFGLDTAAADLQEAREFFRGQEPSAHLGRVLELSGVSGVVMTNDPFDEREARVWEGGESIDGRFHAALRMDRLLNDWEGAAAALSARGFRVEADFRGATVAEVRRFLDRWIERMRPRYMAVSLPDGFKYPDGDARDRVIREVVLPTAHAHSLPFTLMIGVRRGVNPRLRLAGDGLGRADVSAVERLCAENPEAKFLATFLSRENQHELCVAARKFPNLLPFGCWWFLNNPSIIKEITAERLELLGTSFVAQHSDARILEQLIYKWKHSRRVLAKVLLESYERLLESGRAVTRAEVERDAERLFDGNFRAWVEADSLSPERQPFEAAVAESF